MIIPLQEWAPSSIPEAWIADSAERQMIAKPTPRMVVGSGVFRQHSNDNDANTNLGLIYCLAPGIPEDRMVVLLLPLLDSVASIDVGSG